MLAIVAFSGARLSAQAPDPGRTILDGVYTQDQAARGRVEYDAWCSQCHGGENGGAVRAPFLDDANFVDHWREYDVDFLYSMIRNNMPPRSEQKPSDAEYLDILTYILSRNNYPAGDVELTAEVLDDVLFVGSNGPEPVPSGSLAMVIGCLTEVSEDRWGLTGATEPRRTETDSSTGSELEGAATTRAGNLSFRVVNFDYVAAGFTPEPLEGHRVIVKGYLIRQPNAERVNLTAMDSIAESCGQISD